MVDECRGGGESKGRRSGGEVAGNAGPSGHELHDWQPASLMVAILGLGSNSISLSGSWGHSTASKAIKPVHALSRLGK